MSVLEPRRRKPRFRRARKLYAPYVRAHWRPLAAGGAAALGMVAVRLALPLPLSRVVVPWFEAEGRAASGSAPLGELLGAGFTFLGLYVLLGILDQLSRIRFADFAIATVGAVRADGIEALEAGHGKGTVSGDLLSRMVGDTARLKEGLRGFLVHVVTNGALFVGLVLVLAWIDARFAVIMAAALLAVLAITAGSAVLILRRAMKLRAKEGRLASSILHSTRENTAEGGRRSLSKGSQRASLTRLQGRAAWAVYAVLGFAVALCFWAASTDDSDTLFLLSAYSLTLVHPVVRLSRQGTRLGKMLACAARIEEAVRAARKAPKDRLGERPPVLRLEQVELESSRTSGSAPLGPVDLELRPGQRVAVCGPPGSGKTSLLRVLAGQRRPSRGRITWDGEDLEPLTRRSLRLAIAAVDECPRAGLRERRSIAGEGQQQLASASELIARLRAVDTGSEEPALSHTELRSLALEVALVRSPRVLLVDEPTRGLGPRDAARRVRELLAATNGLTVVALTRAELQTGFDRVVELERGRIVFDGPPDRARDVSAVPPRSEGTGGPPQV